MKTTLNVLKNWCFDIRETFKNRIYLILFIGCAILSWYDLGIESIPGSVGALTFLLFAVFTNLGNVKRRLDYEIKSEIKSKIK